MDFDAGALHRHGLKPEFGEGRRQLITLAEIDIVVGRQHAPQIVVPPPRARKTMVDVRRGSNPRRRPHAPQRKSTIAQPLRPFQRHAGVVATFGPLECVVGWRSAFGRVIPIRTYVVGRGGSPLRRAVPVRGAVPVHRQLPPFPDDDRIQPAGVLAERLP